MIHRIEHVIGARHIVEHKSDLRRIVSTNGRRDSAAGPGGGTPDPAGSAPTPIAYPTGRTPATMLSRAGSASPRAETSRTAKSTRPGCDRATCKPGNRCPEHRGTHPVHISTVMAQLVEQWAGDRA